MNQIKFFIRKIIWRALGVDYHHLLKKLDYNLLKYDKFTKIGKGSYDNGAKVWRWTDAKITIGNYCSIAFDVNFIVDEGFHLSSSITNYPFLNHLPKDFAETFKQNQKQGISIGNDVWIGMGAFLLPGVKIGNGATIAANSVVNADVPDYSVVAGCPAKVVKMKLNEKQIESMNKISWWNWGEDFIKERLTDFYTLSVDEFIAKYLSECE